ncbi:inosine-5'-monophosphate dehydrogenase, partial [mine drainage metagenome]
TNNPISIDEDVTIMNVISKLKDHGISQVPVLSGKRYVGMLGYREMLRRKSINISARVGNLAVTSPKLSPDDSIETALRKISRVEITQYLLWRKTILLGLYQDQIFLEI